MVLASGESELVGAAVTLLRVMGKVREGLGAAVLLEYTFMRWMARLAIVSLSLVTADLYHGSCRVL